MKTLSALSAALLVGSMAQAQLVINSTNFNSAISSHNQLKLTSNINPPATGANKTWNYGAAATAGSVTEVYSANNTTNYTNANCMQEVVMGLSVLSLPATVYEQVDGNGFAYKGIHMDRLAISLEPYTSNPNDSLIVLDQNADIIGDDWKIKTPLSFNGTSTHNYNTTLKFKITLTTFGLIDVDMEYRSYVEEEDNVAGWGNVILPVGSGASIPYQALLLHRATTQTDSFYVGGTPAPPALLSAFLLTQGQTSKSYSTYLFGPSYKELAYINHGADDNYAAIEDAHVDGNGQLATGLSNTEAAQAFSLYPNPVVNNNITLVTPQRFCNTATLTDFGGRTIATYNLNNQNTQHNIALPNGLAAGMYLLQLSDNGKAIGTRSFVKP